MKRIISCSLLLVFLAACGRATPTPIPDLTDSAPAPLTPALAPSQTATITSTRTPGPTATLDARLPPERWQEWPVVPAVTGRAIEIYRQGLALGNNPHAFSKVGDCQSVKAAMMGYLDIPERIPQTLAYQNLQESIDNFSGYFNTDGQAVKGGFNAATVLSPLWANPDACLAGENPMECELRVTKPIIVFISFEVWWEGRTAEQYEKYMRQIIETVIAHGAVPILGTKADNVEGDHSLNLTTARLAHEYDLPLWNFWLAVQPLPNHGMDPDRPDGFHISETDGWSVRSFTALQALDSIWQGLRAADVAADDLTLATPTAAPSGTVGLLPTSASGPTLAGIGERLVFGLAARKGDGYQPQGVYLFDFATETSAQLLGPGWDFQAASPDGRTLLVNQGDSLYRTDGLSLTLLTDAFYSYGNTGALYLPDGSIALVLRQDAGTALARLQADGSGLTVLTQPGEAPIELYPSTDGQRIIWESGSCSVYGVCDRQGAWLTDLQSGHSRKLTDISRPLISPTSAALAYEYVPEENRSNLAFASVDGIPVRNFPVYGDILVDYAWHPEGEWLAVHMAVRSVSSGQVTGGGNYLVNAKTLETRVLPSALLLNPGLVWSPDGLSLAWLGTDRLETQYEIRLFHVDVESAQAVNLTSSLGISAADFIFVTNAAWLVNP